MASPERHPILADTSALIAVANTELWKELRDRLRLTTTNVCRQELDRHVRNTSEFAREDSREYHLHYGLRRVLDALEDDEVPFTTVTCVPRPHGEDAGEELLRIELSQHPDAYEVVTVMDIRGRDSIRRSLDRAGLEKPVVAPTYLFYLLLDHGFVTHEQFCTACGEMLRNEGWTGYRAVKAAWEAIPVDCSDVLGDDLLP